MKILRQTLLFISGAVLIGAFQNCAKTNFSQSPEGTLVQSAEFEPEIVDVVPGPEATPETPTPPASPVPKPPKQPIKNADRDCDDKGGSRGIANGPEKAESESAMFVCVLAGAGKSNKLALLNGELAAKTGTPSDICMTEDACRDIVSQKFDVKGPELRGFCKGKNPNVVGLSDEQLQNLIDQL